LRDGASVGGMITGHVDGMIRSLLQNASRDLAHLNKAGRVGGIVNGMLTDRLA